jgi:CDP-diacylglycerol--glycerol-3-phosphate 3-phosphatidyltransferase
MARIGAAPVLVIMLLSPGMALSAAAAAFFTLVSLTDWLDGYLARRMGIITPLGKFLDPLADKILITTAFIMLIPLGRVPAWVVALIIGREMAVTGLRAIASNMGVVIAARRLGKYKTFSQIAALVALMLHYRYLDIDFHAIGTLLLAVAFALTIWSGVDYFVGFFRANALPEG